MALPVAPALAPSRQPTGLAQEAAGGVRLARPLGQVPALDGLRALLVAGVMAYHLANGHLPSALGEVAVIVFFVLSGFLITTVLLEEHALHGRIGLMGFYLRRARRLLPAMVALLAVWLAVALLFHGSAWVTSVPGGGPGAGISPMTALQGVGAALGYVTNLLDAVPRLHLWVGYVPLGHLWSLAIEEQFYVLWAPIMLIVARLRSRPASWAVTTATVVMLAEPWLLWNGSGWGIERVYFGIDSRAGALLAGAAVALFNRQGRLAGLGRQGVSTVALAVAGGGCFVAGMGFVTPLPRRWSWVGGLTLATVCGAMAVASLAVRRDDRTSGWLSHPVLVWAGRRSYAIYLWSYVLNTWVRSFGLLRIPVVITTTLVAAELSFRLVEMPVRTRVAPVASIGHQRGSGPRFGACFDA